MSADTLMEWRDFCVFLNNTSDLKRRAEAGRWRRKKETISSKME